MMLTDGEVDERDPYRLWEPAGWGEDFGAVLWWRIEEDGFHRDAPWCGTPLDDDWPYHEDLEDVELNGDRLLWSFLPVMRQAPEPPR